MNEQPKTKYSLVIPTYNEQDSVAPLHQEIVKTMQGLGEIYEVIFVDDGSTDQTLSRLKQLSPVKIIQFRRNYGQTAALDAGIKAAQGEIIIALDADGQNPPSEIPKLLEKMKEGYDVVSGWRHQRQDSFQKNLTSKGADWLRSFFIKDKIHDSGCTLKAYRKECFNNIDLYGEMHRFIPGVLKWEGFRIGEVKVAHRSRQTGQTKYNWKRIIKGLIDMISVWFWRKYAARPLHLFGGLGIATGGFGLMLGLFLAIARFLGKISLQNNIWPLIAVFMVLAGIQLFISGLLADIAIKNYYCDRKKIYNIKQIIEN